LSQSSASGRSPIGIQIRIAPSSDTIIPFPSGRRSTEAVAATLSSEIPHEPEDENDRDGNADQPQKSAFEHRITCLKTRRRENRVRGTLFLRNGPI
jgi:hypothetical protein